MFYSLQSVVEDLRREEMVLQEHITLLRRDKVELEQIDSKLEEIRKKETNVTEVRMFYTIL